MPMYIDIHEVRGATAEDVAKAHHADEEVQGRYGVQYHKYWLNESTGKIIKTDFAIVLTVANGEIVRFQMLEDSFAVSKAARG